MRYVPSPYELSLLALAAWRVWKLVADDKISDRPVDFVLRHLPNRAYWREFLVCPYCFGAWTSIAWWAAWMLWPHATLIVAVPFAISALVGLVATAWHAVAD